MSTSSDPNTVAEMHRHHVHFIKSNTIASHNTTAELQHQHSQQPITLILMRVSCHSTASHPTPTPLPQLRHFIAGGSSAGSVSAIPPPASPSPPPSPLPPLSPSAASIKK